MTQLYWKSVAPLEWSLRISNSNYMFVKVAPLAEGGYRVTYIDADLTDYTRNEKAMVRIKYKLTRHQYTLLAYYLTLDHGHYEWTQTCHSLAAVSELLDNETSFNLSHLPSEIEGGFDIAPPAEEIPVPAPPAAPKGRIRRPLEIVKLDGKLYVAERMPADE